MIDNAKFSLMLKKAKFHEEHKDFKRAAKAYLDLVKLKLDKSNQAKYYSKVAESYARIETKLKEEKHRNKLEALDYYKKSADVYGELKDYSNAGLCYMGASRISAEVGEMPQAAEYESRAAEMYYYSGNMFQAGIAYMHAAEYYEQLGDHGKAAEYYVASANINSEVGDSRNASNSYKKAAQTYEKLGNLEKAVDCYASSTAIDLTLRDYSSVTETYQNIARCYEGLGRLDDAMYYYKKSAESNISNQDYGNAAGDYSNMGRCYEGKKDYGKAIESYQRSAEMSFKVGDNKNIAASDISIARCHENLENYAKAAEFYSNAGKAYVRENDQPGAAKAYQRAVAMNSKLAESRLGEGDHAKAAEFYLKAAEGYLELKDPERAADNYISYGEIMYTKLDNKEKAFEGYRQAAESFISGGNLLQAGRAYAMATDYAKAADYFTKYAESRSEKKDLYGAGEGYKLAARIYQRLQYDAQARDMHTKSVWNYGRYIEEVDKKHIEYEAEKYVDARKSRGECYHSMDDLPHAREDFTKASEIYSELNESELVDLVNGFLDLVEAEHHLDIGEYPKASELLHKSLDSFSKYSSLDREYMHYIQAIKDSVQESLNKIELKPDVTLVVDQRSYTFVNTTLVLNTLLTNNGKYSIKNISFLAHLPDQLKINRLPDTIDVIESTQSSKTSIEVVSDQYGSYRVKPLEVFYEDRDGHKYVKASNEVLVEVVERPVEDYKHYAQAVDVYLKYASTQYNNGNYFYSGNGYKMAAECYGKFKTDNVLKDYYRKAMDSYMKYVEGESGKEGDDPVKIKWLGDACRSIAECHSSLNESEQARDYFKKSLVYYDRIKTDDKAVSQAFLNKVEAKISIEHGDYQNAARQLTDSLRFFDQAIKRGGWEKNFVEYLERHESEAKAMRDQLKVKPEAIVSVPESLIASVNKTLELVVTVTNPGKELVKNIKPLLKMPMEFKSKIPEGVSELSPGSSAEIVIEVTPSKEGSFRFKPLDISYMDSAGTAYTRGSNETTVVVGGAAAAKPKPVAATPTPEVVAGEAPAEKPSAGEGKPEIDLILDRPGKAQIGVNLVIEGKIENKGVATVKGVRFLASTPTEFEVVSQPEPIEKLGPMQSMKVSLEVKPQARGEYTFKPIEMFYKDEQGNRFFKGSNELTIKVGEVSAEEKETRGAKMEGKALKNKVVDELNSLGGNAIALLSYDSSVQEDVISAVIELLSKERGCGGVYISFSRPYIHIKAMLEAAGLDISNLYFVDCISSMTGKMPAASTGGDNIVYVENPSSLEEVGIHVDKMLEKIETESKFIILDSVSSILIYNSPKSSEEFIHFLVSKMRLKNVEGVILSIRKKESEELIKTLTPLCDKTIEL